MNISFNNFKNLFKQHESVNWKLISMTARNFNFKISPIIIMFEHSSNRGAEKQKIEIRLKSEAINSWKEIKWSSSRPTTSGT